MRAMALVGCLAAGSACASTSPSVKEREAVGITKIALGAPLVISGSVGVLGGGVGVAVVSSTTRPPPELIAAYIGLATLGAVEMFAGSILIGSGQSDYAGDVRPSTQRERSMRRRRADPPRDEDAPRMREERPQPSDESELWPSRVIQPVDDDE